MATQKMEFYKCNHCKQVIEVLHGGATPSCCGEPMKQLIAGSTDGAKEKHVPVIEAAGDRCIIKVGSVAHPMQEEHSIEWIEIICKRGTHYRKYLNPGEAPEANFPIKASSVVAAYEYCNLHGLWKIEVEGASCSIQG